MKKSLVSLYTSPRWLLRRWRWKLGLKVSVHVITSKFSEISGSTTYKQTKIIQVHTKEKSALYSTISLNKDFQTQSRFIYKLPSFWYSSFCTFSIHEIHIKCFSFHSSSSIFVCYNTINVTTSQDLSVNSVTVLCSSTFPTVASFSSVAYRERWFGGFNPPPKFRRYWWSPWSHEEEEPSSRFPFVVHRVLIRL